MGTDTAAFNSCLLWLPTMESPVVTPAKPSSKAATSFRETPRDTAVDRDPACSDAGERYQNKDAADTPSAKESSQKTQAKATHQRNPKRAVDSSYGHVRSGQIVLKGGFSLKQSKNKKRKKKRVGDASFQEKSASDLLDEREQKKGDRHCR